MGRDLRAGAVWVGRHEACLGEGMNSTMFSVKRAFLKTVHFGRKLLEPFGLTPARFDLMNLLRNRPHRMQAELWQILGLHPSTVSKMLRRLEELELVYRNYDLDDARRTVVKLAPNGTKALEAAFAELVENGAIDGFMGWAVAGPHRAENKREVAVLNLEEGLLRVRRTFFDTARLLYVFDPAKWLEHANRELPHWPRENAPLAFSRAAEGP